MTGTDVFANAQMKSKTMINPLTAATFAARGPSIWTREDPSKSRLQQANELAWVDGSQPAHKGKAIEGEGLTARREFDAQAMLEMHLAGTSWREIGRTHGCSQNTAQKAVKDAFPHRIRAKDPKPASQIVIRNQADADKTGRIQGTGVTA